MPTTNYIFGIFLVLLVATCDNKETSTTDDTEVWKLVSMETRMVKTSNQEELSMSQTYSFLADGTFVKTQSRDGKNIEGSGTFKVTTADDGTYYTLLYDQGKEIIGSCMGNDNEELRIRDDGKLQNSWMMCDGPMLVYEKQ